MKKKKYAAEEARIREENDYVPARKGNNSLNRQIL